MKINKEINYEAVSKVTTLSVPDQNNVRTITFPSGTYIIYLDFATILTDGTDDIKFKIAHADTSIQPKIGTEYILRCSTITINTTTAKNHISFKCKLH